jgi:diguanylate cyclase (GGDEF)-like protein
MRSGSGVATLILDMDRFKEINDMLGHEIGDKLLIETGKRIRASVRDQDTVARLGGDEFAVVLEGVSEAKEVLPVIERIANSLREVNTIDGHEVNTSISTGIAMYPENGSDLSELLRAADLAMYQAKSSGRACYQFFADAMQEEAQSRRALEWALRRAVEAHEFQLVYQPQICLRTGGVIGVEALIRWMHPTRGLLTPYHFIGALEEFGLINDVGQWVLQTACEQLREWHATDLKSMRMSVNVSAQQFEDPMLMDKVRSALDETKISPEFLELELTESCLMSDPAQAGALLREIRDAGVRIAIDDFGTGYSSLTYLNEFPLNALKIDKSFVQSIGANDRGGPISNMIIGLGQTLGLEVIAEGVETEGQLQYMQEHGCDIAQGYLYARPESPSDLTPWLQANQRSSGTYVRSMSIKEIGDGTNS